jgi:hypothetical protein
LWYKRGFAGPVLELGQDWSHYSIHQIMAGEEHVIFLRIVCLVQRGSSWHEGVDYFAGGIFKGLQMGMCCIASASSTEKRIQTSYRTSRHPCDAQVETWVE